MFIHVWVRVRAYVHMCIYASLSVCLSVCMYLCTDICMYDSVCTHVTLYREVYRVYVASSSIMALTGQLFLLTLGHAQHEAETPEPEAP